VIKSFDDKGLLKLFVDGDGRKVQPKHVRKLKQILAALNVATHPGQLDMPGLRFHAMTGKMKGYFAVSVDENYRVVFKFEAGNAREVDYVDCH
jgi:proteic killer suppression protein